MNVRVVRGAAFFTDGRSQIISSYRGRPPILQNFASGFRVCLALKANGEPPVKGSPAPAVPTRAIKDGQNTNRVSLQLGDPKTETAGGITHLADTGGSGTRSTLAVVGGVPCRLLRRPGRY